MSPSIPIGNYGNIQDFVRGILMGLRYIWKIIPFDTYLAHPGLARIQIEFELHDGPYPSETLLCPVSYCDLRHLMILYGKKNK